LHNDDCSNFRLKPVNEALGKIEGITDLGVGVEVIFELTEFIHIGLDRGMLADVKEPAQQDFMLVAIELIVEKAVERIPRGVFKLRLNILVPVISWAFEIHLGDTEPKRFIHQVHVKVFFTAAPPAARIFAIEFGKRKFGKVAQISCDLRQISRAWKVWKAWIGELCSWRCDAEIGDRLGNWRLVRGRKLVGKRIG